MRRGAGLMELRAIGAAACGGPVLTGSACSRDICFIRSVTGACLTKPPRCCGVGTAPQCGSEMVDGREQTLMLVRPDSVDSTSCVAREPIVCF